MHCTFLRGNSEPFIFPIHVPSKKISSFWETYQLTARPFWHWILKTQYPIITWPSEKEKNHVIYLLYWPFLYSNLSIPNANNQNLFSTVWPRQIGVRVARFAVVAPKWKIKKNLNLVNYKSFNGILHSLQFILRHLRGKHTISGPIGTI